MILHAPGEAMVMGMEDRFGFYDKHNDMLHLFG